MAEVNNKRKRDTLGNHCKHQQIDSIYEQVTHKKATGAVGRRQNPRHML